MNHLSPEQLRAIGDRFGMSPAEHADFGASVTLALNDENAVETLALLVEIAKHPFYEALSAAKELLVEGGYRPLSEVSLYLKPLSSIKWPLGTRIETLGRKKGVTMFHQLIRYSREELLAFPDMGEKSVAKIEQTLASVGMSLRRT